MNPILSALSENFGGPTNVQGLLALLQQEGCALDMAAESAERLHQEARQSALRAAHLVTSNPQFCPEYRGQLGRLAQCSREAADTLERLAGELREQRIPQPLVDKLADCQARARAAYEAIRQPVLRCPRCARAGERCDACGLEGLYADPNPLPETDPELLPGLFLQLYEIILAVGRGEVSLQSLGGLIEQLHGEIASLYEQLPAHPNREALQEQARGMLQALERMEAVFQSRQLADLHTSWGELYGHHLVALSLLA